MGFQSQTLQSLAMGPELWQIVCTKLPNACTESRNPAHRAAPRAAGSTGCASASLSPSGRPRFISEVWTNPMRVVHHFLSLFLFPKLNLP